MASFANVKDFGLPNFSEFSHQVINSDIAEICSSDPDNLGQVSESENCTLVNDFADNKFDLWEEYGHLTYSQAEESPLDLDSFGLSSSGDNSSLDPWYEVLTTSLGHLPKIQTDNSSLNVVPDLCAVYCSKPLEGSVAVIPSSNTLSSHTLSSIPVSITPGYHATPNLRECSTQSFLSSSDDFSDNTTRRTISFDTENQRWDATLSRSRAADRYFLYGVMTTKIFCRPSCASRRPSRRHVRFFSFPGAIEAAKQMGFRPCRRCKPEHLGPANTGVFAIAEALRKIIAVTFEEGSEEGRESVKLNSLAKSAGLSTFHFHRLFKATTSITPADFISACHALSLQDNLCTYSTQGTAANPCRVQLSPRWSQRTARKALGGLSPQEYADGPNSTAVEYCRVSSPAGDLEVTYSAIKDSLNVRVHALIHSKKFSLTISDHLWKSKGSEERTQRFQQCIRELEEKCQDRDVELAADVLSVLWRARLWLKLTQDNGIR